MSTPRSGQRVAQQFVVVHLGCGHAGHVDPACQIRRHPRLFGEPVERRHLAVGQQREELRRPRDGRPTRPSSGFTVCSGEAAGCVGVMAPTLDGRPRTPKGAASGLHTAPAIMDVAVARRSTRRYREMCVHDVGPHPESFEQNSRRRRKPRPPAFFRRTRVRVWTPRD